MGGCHSGILSFGADSGILFSHAALYWDRIGLHPLWILFALAAFGSFWGFTGLLLAIPAAATLGIALSHTIGFYKGSVLYHQRGEDSSQ